MVQQVWGIGARDIELESGVHDVIGRNQEGTMMAAGWGFRDTRVGMCHQKWASSGGHDGSQMLS